MWKNVRHKRPTFFFQQTSDGSERNQYFTCTDCYLVSLFQSFEVHVFININMEMSCSHTNALDFNCTMDICADIKIEKENTFNFSYYVGSLFFCKKKMFHTMK